MLLKINDMSTNSLHFNNNLKNTLFSLPKGIPITTKYLNDNGISRQLAYKYVRSKWLIKLGRGYFQRQGDQITSTGAVVALETQGLQVHIGGKSALSLHGFTHYVSMKEPSLLLYVRNTNRLPTWLEKHFSIEIRMPRLFKEPDNLDKRLFVTKLNNDKSSPYVSSPERAILEMLDDVPKKQSLDESKKLMETLANLRPKVMQELLEKCVRIKVKRLFVSLGDELKLTVINNLKLSKIDFGSSSEYIYY